MFMDFIKLTFIDVIDILLVTYLFFYLYKIIKGTVAFNIFIGLLILYLLYYIVALLNMELLSELFGQFISVGFIALIILLCSFYSLGVFDVYFIENARWFSKEVFPFHIPAGNA